MRKKEKVQNQSSLASQSTPEEIKDKSEEEIQEKSPPEEKEEDGGRSLLSEKIDRED